jgi:acetyl-CoA C-acetyltransferase
VDKDEEPFRVDLDKMSKLRPAFKKDGTVTPANASKINDGAAALILTTQENAKRLGKTPLARIVAQASVAQDPDWFTTAPSAVVRKVLERASLKPDDIDLWEVNEAFAVVAMAFLHDLPSAPRERAFWSPFCTPWRSEAPGGAVRRSVSVVERRRR